MNRQPKSARNSLGPCILASRLTRKGFTYIELLFVVLILGIASAIAAPQFRGMQDRYAAEAAACRLTLDLALAREHARTTGARQTVTFSEPPGETYQLPGMPDAARPTRDYLADLGDYGAHLENVDFGGDLAVVFNRFGVPDGPGAVTIRAGAVVKTVSLQQSGQVTER